MSKKKSVSMSIDEDIDDFLQKCTEKVINIDGHEIVITKTKNELYNKALQYAMENADDWLFFRKKKNEN